MKKNILLLLLLAPSLLFAQIRKEVTFDFTDPTSLNPKVNPDETKGGKVPVTNLTFTNGPVSLSAQGEGTGTEYVTITPHQVYEFRIRYGASVTLKTNVEGGVINSFRFSDDSQPGSLEFPGRSEEEIYQFVLTNSLYWRPMNPETNTFDDSYGIPSITMNNTSHDSRINKLTVVATVPSDILVPSADIANGAYLTSFEELNLSFANAMQIQDASGIILKKAGNASGQTLSASVSGKIVTLSSATPITEAGNYTITIPARAFKDTGDGYENKDLTYSFTIAVNYESVTPATGRVESLTSPITLTFPEEIKLKDGVSTVNVLKDGNTDGTLTLSLSADSKSLILGNASGEISSTTDNGAIFTIVIPEGYIYNKYYKTDGNEALVCYNKEIKLEYQVRGDTETMTLAKSLLGTAYTGLGYPTAESAARTALSDAVNQATAPSDDDLATLISNFYKETSIVLPVKDKFYKIASKDADGNLLYVSQAAGGLGGTTNAQAAYVFKLVSVSATGEAVFQTKAGKYFSLTKLADAEANVTLGKLAVTGIKEENLFGLFSISSNSQYAQGDFNALTFKSASEQIFQGKSSSGFIFEEVSDADGGLTPTTTAFTLTPVIVNKNTDTPVLTFSSVANVQLINPAAPYLKDASGNIVMPEGVNVLTAVAGSNNSFNVHLDGLADATYTLVVPAGSVTYTANNKTVTASEITSSIKIEDGDAGYNKSFDSFIYLQSKGVDTPVTDESLNDMVLYIIIDRPYSGMVPDPTKVVKLSDYDDRFVVRTGHFEQYTDIQKDLKLDAIQGIRFVIDSSEGPIKLGELKSGRYKWVIPEAAFGDANFGKRQSGDMSISANQCIVNRAVEFSVLVNNKEANKVRPDAAVYAQAQSLLTYSGIGYPTALSSARAKLEVLVEQNEGENSVYQSAMKEFYASTDVVKPTAGKYYRVIAQTSTGAEAYLKYDGKTVSVTKTRSEATGFKVTANNNGTFRLTTGDSRYLRQLSAGGSLSDTYVAAQNDLSLDKLTISGVDAEKTFGLFSIKAEGTYSLVDAKTPAIQTATASLTTFAEDKTCAFTFEEIAASDIPVPTVTATLNPATGSEMDNLSQVTIAFSGAAGVALANRSLITLTAGLTSITAASVSAVAGKTNEFAITFSGVANGQTYVLNVAEGAFTFAFAEQTHKVAAVTATYTVKEEKATEAQMADARETAALSGVGYPKAGSEARKALEALISSGNATSAALTAAVNAFLADTDVELPSTAQTGKYYYLSAVASNGNEVYLSFDGEKLLIISDKEAASTFEVIQNADGSSTFKTIEGKYLSLPNSTNDGDFTDEYTAGRNNLTLSRLQIAGKSAEETLGLFSLYGTLSSGSAYALVNVKSGSILTDPDFGLDKFTEGLTNAFRLTASDKFVTKVSDILMDKGLDGAVYDLQGRRIDGTLKSGTLYIRNGRKFIAK